MKPLSIDASPSISNELYLGELDANGTAAANQAKANLNEAHPEIRDISYHPPKDENDLSAPIYDVNRLRTCSWIPWHSDLVYMDTINRGGILRAIKVPAGRGTTGFIDRILAYEPRSDDLKKRIDGLHVIYQLNVHMQTHPFIRGFARDIQEVRNSSVGGRIDKMIAEGKYPPVVHPMTYVQKETGRKVLNVSPTFALGVLEMQTDAARRLIEMRTPEIRRAILAETDDKSLPLDQAVALLAARIDQFFAVEEPLEYEPEASRRFGVLAAAAGQTPEEYLYDYLVSGFPPARSRRVSPRTSTACTIAAYSKSAAGRILM